MLVRCPHCTNDDKRMMELVHEFRAHGIQEETGEQIFVYEAYIHCNVCSHGFKTFLSKPYASQEPYPQVSKEESKG